MPHEDHSTPREDLLEDDELTDSVPKVTPEYPSDELRDLGERLAALYYAREIEPDRTGVAEEIARIRSQMRRGPRLHAGEFLADGRYRLLTRRDAGTSGDALWQAWERTSGQLVLVRVFHGGWVDRKKAVEQFRERGATLRKLVHPHLARVLDADRSDDGFVYLVTAHVGDQSLADAVSDTGLVRDAIDAVEVAIELAQALQYCHEIGVVHGDVRPENVLMSPEGSAFLTHPSVEPIAGKAEPSLYQAPETTERGYEPAPAADVYALGMTLLAALNKGSLPFWVLRDPSRLLRQVAVSDGVRSVIARATDWELSARYADLAALVEDLVADPELVEALADRARERGRFDIAAQHLENLLRIQSHRAVEIRTALGEVYTSLGAYDQAFGHLLAALERTADVETLFAPLRVVASRTGDWSRLASALWSQARARDAGRRVVLRVELARINQDELKNPIAAAETWTQVLADHRLPSQAVTALRALQGLARDRRDWAGFVEYGKELLEYLPEDQKAAVQYALGRAYIEHLDDEEAGLPFIDAAEERGWSEPDLGQRLQQIRAHRGQWRRVIHLMVQQAAGQELGDASPTLLRAGIIASSVHLEEEAFTVYHALLQRAPRHVVALRHLARLHHRAHEADKALRFYERLWETYRGKDSEEPEASERAADCMAYAQLLLKKGDAAGACERLEEALRLNPNHVPSLQLAGPLFLARGDTGAAATVFDRLLAQFKSVEHSPQKIEACLGMGDLAWVQGRLTAAMGWFNRALELDPFSVAGWWGLAKVAMSSRSGHPGADRAPWVMAMPKRFTGQEALARLLAGTLQLDAMKAWLRLTALGRSALEGGEVGMRVACAVVDVMVRNDLVAPELFQRIGDARPEWSEPVDEVQRLWFGGGAAAFAVARTYGWSRRLLTDDFDPLAVRSVLPSELRGPQIAVESLRDTNSWGTLFEGDLPRPPDPFTMIEPQEASAPRRWSGPVGALVRDGLTWLALGRDRGEVDVGADPATDLKLEDPLLSPRHARMYRQGGRIYLQKLGDGPVQVDGEDRDVWRLHGGERVTLGETRMQFQAYADEAHLPPLARIAHVGTFEETPPPAAERPEPPPAPPASEEADTEGPDEPVEPTAPLEAPAPVEPEPHEDEAIELPSAEEDLPPPDEDEDDDDDDDDEEFDLSADLAPPVRREVGPETTGPIEDVLPLPAVDPQPRLVTGPIRMPADVMEPTGPIPDAITERLAAEEEEHTSDPPSDEELIQPRAREEVLEATTAPTPVSDMDLDLPEDDPSARESGPLQALHLASLEEAEPEEQEPEASPALPDDFEAGPDPSSEIDPELSDEVEFEAAPEAEADEDPPIPSNVPDWLRRALMAEEEAEASVDEPAAEPPADEAPAEPPPGSVTVPIPEASGPFAGDEPDRSPQPTGVTAVPAVEDEGLSEEDAPQAVAEVAPPYEPDAPTVVVPSVPREVLTAPIPRHIRSAPTNPPPSTFGFPEEVADDDVDSLRTVPRPLPAGVTGTTVVPLERELGPSGGESAPPAPPRTRDDDDLLPSAGPSGYLEFMSGPERGRRVPVADEITVGQSPMCGVSIAGDARLSAVHCRVRRLGEGFHLSDEGSQTGTVVNGQRVTEVGLTGGEVIMVGRTVLRFRMGDD
ncbi:MAG: FHA domain-containing protein [Alphaproteobacteria bacterium]|nr:FHA domain-containing protein [Alphaproteobacteria bacterium]MCB9695492.1 FHA domain-containing protein [Alphaproteobacteria bacterium]